MSVLNKLKNDGSIYNGDLKGGLPKGTLIKDVKKPLNGFNTFSKGQYTDYLVKVAADTEEDIYDDKSFPIRSTAQ